MTETPKNKQQEDSQKSAEYSLMQILIQKHLDKADEYVRKAKKKMMHEPLKVGKVVGMVN